MQTQNASPPPLLGPEGFGYWRSFSRNILDFLQARGTEVQLPNLPSIRCWFVPLDDGTRLHVYAEAIGPENASCDQCRIIGWGTHPVSSVRYHFIVPAEVGPDSLEDHTSLPAIAEASHATPAQVSAPVALPSATVIAGEGHVSPYNAPSTIFDSSRHRLHGVLHANGYGHLLRVNGREGGSRTHTGAQMAALWDAMCVGLRARSVTVEDVSAKAGMELRVLHTAAYGHTWYGGFGYEFGRGPYNISRAVWEAAGHAVTTASLAHVLFDFEGVEAGVPAVVRRYMLPVGSAARVRDLGSLLYRLLWLQARPEEGLQFFDPGAVEAATAVVRAADEAEAAKRAAQRAGAQEAKRRASAAASAAARARALAAAAARPPPAPAPAPALPKIKLRVPEAAGDAPASPGSGRKRGAAAEAAPAPKRPRAGGAASPAAGGSPSAAAGPSSTDVPPTKIVGRKIKAYFKSKRTWYAGQVDRRDPRTGLYVVAFRDFEEAMDLSDEGVKFLDGPAPPAAALRPKPAAAKKKKAGGGEPAGEGPQAPKLPQPPQPAQPQLGGRVRVFVRERRGFRVAHVTAQISDHLYRITFLDEREAELDTATARWELAEAPPAKEAAAPAPPRPQRASAKKRPPGAEEAEEEEEEEEEAGEVVEEEEKAPEPEPAAEKAPPPPPPSKARAAKKKEKAAPAAPSLPPPQPPPPLPKLDFAAPPMAYKARMARDDGGERARQLTRALRSLCPGTKYLFAEATVRAETDAVLRFLSSCGAPELSYRQGWWEALPALLRWAQAAAGAEGGGDAGDAVRLADPATVEIDRAFLYSLGLFPEAWPAPFEAVALKEANAAAAAAAAAQRPAWERERAAAAEAAAKKAAAAVAAAPAAAAPEVKVKKEGEGAAEPRSTRRTRQADAKAAAAAQEAAPRTRQKKGVAPEPKAEQATANGGPPAPEPLTSPAGPSCAAPAALGLPVPPAMPFPGPNGSVGFPPLRARPRPPLPPDAVERLVAACPGHPDILPASSFPRPPAATLPPLILPAAAPPWGLDRLLVALRHVASMAKAHRGQWVSPQRLTTMAQQSFAKQGLKEIPLARAAMAYMGNTLFEGFAVHRAEHPAGGMYYFTEEAPEGLAAVMGPVMSAPMAPAAAGAPGAAPRPPPSPAAMPAAQGAGAAAGQGAGGAAAGAARQAKRQKAEPKPKPAAAEDAGGGKAGGGGAKVGATAAKPAAAEKEAAKKAEEKKEEKPDKPKGTTFKLTLSQDAKQQQKEAAEAAAAEAAAAEAAAAEAAPADAAPPAGAAAARGAIQRPPVQQQAVDAALAAALNPFPPPPPPLPPGFVAVPTPAAAPPPPPPAWMHLQPGADVPQPAAPAAVKAQITRDLHHLWLAVFRCYAPALARTAAEAAAAAAGGRAAVRAVKLKQLPGEVRVLRDTKHFMKACSGEPAALGPAGATPAPPEPPPGHLRVWCKVAVPPELASPPMAPTRFGRKFLPVDPPAELIVLPPEATLGDFMAAVTEHFRGVYRMCAGFTASAVVSGLLSGAGGGGGGAALHNGGASAADGSTTAAAAAAPPPPPGLWDPSVPLAAVLPREPPHPTLTMASIGLAPGGSAAAPGGVYIPHVVVAGTGMDLTAEWLHAGGPEDWIVACSCGTRDDDGEAMLSCDACGVWYHTRCAGVPEDAPAWQCPHCERRSRQIAG